MNGLEQVKQATHDSCRGLCLQQGLPYSSLMRWRGRRRRGLPLVSPRGPVRLPLNAAGLWDRVRSLQHGRHRTFGAPSVYPAFRDQLARRYVRALVRSVRQEVNRAATAAQRRIEWLAPGLVWSMDDLERRDLGQDPVFWHQVQDLASRYKFVPLMGRQPPSDEIALHLRHLFHANEPPLFLKRDNGGNLNGDEVNIVLDEHLVIPLNSPPRYPPYNGGIEVAQGEFQDALVLRRAADPTVVSHLPLMTEVITHDLNHQGRPCLDGQCSCVRYFTGRLEQPKYNRAQRKEVYREILALVDEMRVQLGEVDERTAQALWRRAVETWMQAHGLIRIKEPSECYPVFSKMRSHQF